MTTIDIPVCVTPSPPAAPSLRHAPWKYRRLVAHIRTLESQFAAESDLQLHARMRALRDTIRDTAAETGISFLDPHLPTVFALVSVVAHRTLRLRPYHVQLIGGYELHHGRIAEMATGEGKTLVATLPASLNALTGRGVHIVTVNDYLAQRDAQLMGPIYHTLGLTVGVIVSGLSDAQRRLAYRCDIVYGTNKEFGFDFLRDQIKLHDKSRPRPLNLLALLNQQPNPEPVMRSLHYAIVDEADSILIDESRTPLIIAGPSGPSPLAWAFQWADSLAQRLRPRHDFELKIDQRRLEWNEAGRTRLQKILRATDTPSVSGNSWPNLVLNALRARWLFHREQHYVLAADEVVIVDEFTGRRMPGRTWSEGLHQAVQAKEHLPVLCPAVTLTRTTYQHFFNLYEKTAGMTGTALTEAREFRQVYSLPVVRIPTNRPVRRQYLPDLIFRTTREKWLAVAREIAAVTATGRPVLVGTRSIEESEALSAVLNSHHLPHSVLNAKPENAAKEADIIAHAGQHAAVTIATNMAGRGTDILLGPGIADLGGLHVLATAKHDSRRVDHQLFGRCARQGDPGSCRFILSLQDPLLQHMLDRPKLARLRRRQHVPYGHPLRSRRAPRLFTAAQHRIEAFHHRVRQQLLEYEDWLNQVYHQMGSP